MLKKVFVLTGATSGIGKALAVDLAKTGETLVIVARDAERGKAALGEIGVATQNPNLDLQLCDLSVLSSVRNLAEILKSRYSTIDVLINNASVHKRKRVVTVDGFEEMFAANHLGPFLLTNLLLETLQAAVQTNGSARVLNITAPSTVSLNFDDLQGERNFNSLNTFGATKMANLLFTLELARRLENTGITVNAIHPGLARSGIMKEGFFLMRLLTRLVSPPAEKVTGPILQAIIAPEFEKTTGKFLHNGKEMDVPAYAQDRTAQQRLWEISESLTQLNLTKGVTPINDPHLEQNNLK
jgi:retinol dehydrogenase 12